MCGRRYSILLRNRSYEASDDDVKSAAYAKVKPHKVNDAMKVFSDPRYNVDVLKVEVPVNMNFVEGFTKEGVEPVYTREEALRLFKEQSEILTYHSSS